MNFLRKLLVFRTYSILLGERTKRSFKLYFCIKFGTFQLCFLEQSKSTVPWPTSSFRKCFRMIYFVWYVACLRDVVHSVHFQWLDLASRHIQHLLVFLSFMSFYSFILLGCICSLFYFNVAFSAQNRDSEYFRLAVCPSRLIKSICTKKTVCLIYNLTCVFTGCDVAWGWIYIATTDPQINQLQARG